MAEHSYWVTLYTGRLCAKLNLNELRTVAALRYALIHDSEEQLFSDLPGPVKRHITHEEVMSRVFHEWAEPEYSKEIYAAQQVDDLIKKVVKAADILDQLLWTFIEVRMGNQFLWERYNVAANRMKTALEDLGLPEEWESIRSQFNKASVGLRFPEYKK